MTVAEATALLELADEWDLPPDCTGPTAEAWVLAAAQLRTKVVTLGEAAR